MKFVINHWRRVLVTLALLALALHWGAMGIIFALPIHSMWKDILY